MDRIVARDDHGRGRSGENLLDLVSIEIPFPALVGETCVLHRHCLSSPPVRLEPSNDMRGIPLSKLSVVLPLPRPTQRNQLFRARQALVVPHQDGVAPDAVAFRGDHLDRCLARLEGHRRRQSPAQHTDQPQGDSFETERIVLEQVDYALVARTLKDPLIWDERCAGPAGRRASDIRQLQAGRYDTHPPLWSVPVHPLIVAELEQRVDGQRPDMRAVRQGVVAGDGVFRYAERIQWLAKAAMGEFERIAPGTRELDNRAPSARTATLAHARQVPLHDIESGAEQGQLQTCQRQPIHEQPMSHQHRRCRPRSKVQPDVDGVMPGHEHGRRPIGDDLVDLVRRVVLLPIVVGEPGVIHRTSPGASVGAPTRPEKTLGRNGLGPISLAAVYRWSFLFVVVALWVAPVSAQSATHVDVYARGLVNPKGMVFAPDGVLYVAESGKPGEVMVPLPVNFGGSGPIGTNARVSRISAGGQRQDFVTGLPNVGLYGGIEMLGATGMAVLNGTLFELAAGHITVSPTLSRVSADGKLQTVADIGAYNRALPVPRDNGDAVPMGNPYDMVALGGNLYVTDGNYNRVLKVTPQGTVSTL